MLDRRFLQKAAVVLLLSVVAVTLSSCNKDTPVENEKENAAETTTDSKAGKVVLSVELPEAVPGGTPVNLPPLPNMEEDTGGSHPVLYVPEGTTNVALNKPVTSSDDEPIGDLSMIVDGNMRGDEGEWVELGPDNQHVTVDLGEQHEIYAVMIWHYNKDKRVYFDVAVQIADDADFVTNTVVFNNDIDDSLGLGTGKDKNYIENGKEESDYSRGKLIDAKGVKGQFVRFHSAGNHTNDRNQYVEVSVFGKIAK